MDGFSASDWTTAGATVVLAILTGIYVVNIGRAGYHARRSAGAAERAAEAAQEAAAIARATSDPDFQVTAVVSVPEQFRMIRLESTSATVWVHGVTLGLWDSGGRVANGAPCEFMEPPTGPALVHKGNAILCGWPVPPPGDSEAWAYVHVRYSFTEDGEILMVGRPCQMI